MIRPAASVDKYQTVAFDRNRYSVPRSFAFQLVTVKGYVDRIVIVAGSQVIATHKRSLKPGPPILDALHYLPTLGHKPGALDHAPVYLDWKLPACRNAFRSELEQHYGAIAGTRRFVRVLQLAIDPHRVRSFSKRHMRRHRLDEAACPTKAAQTFFVLDADTCQPVCFTNGTSAPRPRSRLRNYSGWPPRSSTPNLARRSC